jgi:hypothetical protein
MDLFHYENPDEEFTIKLELAKEFSRRFVRKQIELSMVRPITKN